MLQWSVLARDTEFQRNPILTKLWETKLIRFLSSWVQSSCLKEAVIWKNHAFKNREFLHPFRRQFTGGLLQKPISRSVDGDPVRWQERAVFHGRSRGSAAYRSTRMSDRVIARCRSAWASCNQPVGALFLTELSIKLSELTLTVRTTKLSSRKLRPRWSRMGAFDDEDNDENVDNDGHHYIHSSV